MAAMLHTVRSTVRWRRHRILENFDENDSPVPDKFRKIPSASSLNNVRMSLRKRLTRKHLEANVSESPTWESLELKEKEHPIHTMKRNAKNAFGNVSQKIQKTCKSQSKYLVASPDKQTMGRKCRITAIGKNKTDLYSTPCRRSSKQMAMSTPSSVSKSTKRMSPQSGLVKKRNNSERKELTFSQWIGKELSLRRSLRRTALKSPYSSLTAARRRQFDKDLETVSTGIRQLRRLSQVFDEVFVRDEREEAIAHYQSLTANNVLHLQHTQRFSLASLRMGARRLGCTAGNLTESVLTSITNAGAH